MTSPAREPSPSEPGGDERPSEEPDYRFSLAAERTFLAYARTALALFAAGVAVSTALPSAGQKTLRHVLGVLLTVLGVLVVIEVRRRFVQVDRAMRTGGPLPRNRLAPLLTLGLVLAGVFAVVLIVGS
jgi:inner membrane protein YidH